MQVNYDHGVGFRPLPAVTELLREAGYHTAHFGKWNVGARGNGSRTDAARAAAALSYPPKGGTYGIDVISIEYDEPPLTPRCAKSVRRGVTTPGAGNDRGDDTRRGSYQQSCVDGLRNGVATNHHHELRGDEGWPEGTLPETSDVALDRFKVGGREVDSVEGRRARAAAQPHDPPVGDDGALAGGEAELRTEVAVRRRHRRLPHVRRRRHVGGGGGGNPRRRHVFAARRLRVVEEAEAEAAVG